MVAGDWVERERNGRQAPEMVHRCDDELDQLKAAFLGAVTHELLTPFASVGLALQVLQRETGNLRPDQQEALDSLVMEIAGLRRLVTGVVKFAELVGKRRQPQRAIVSLSQVIPWAVQPAAALAQARDVEFQVDVPPYLARVYADPELLGEAVFQMSHNAVKFNLPGGQVQVRALESDGRVVIEVADTGVGLTPERMALLGQPFEQNADALRRGQEGLGVGWAFVRYVAEAHGGWTHVASLGPGQGSTFSLVMPVVTSTRRSGVVCGRRAGE